MVDLGNSPDELKRLIGAASQQQNGHAPILSEQRRSGWKCPLHGTQNQATFADQNLGIVRFQVDPDTNEPEPVAAIVVFDGVKTKHCLQCYQEWQRAQHAKEIRDHVTQLVRDPDYEPLGG